MIALQDATLSVFPQLNFFDFSLANGQPSVYNSQALTSIHDYSIILAYGRTAALDALLK